MNATIRIKQRPWTCYSMHTKSYARKTVLKRLECDGNHGNQNRDYFRLPARYFSSSTDDENQNYLRYIHRGNIVHGNISASDDNLSNEQNKSALSILKDLKAADVLREKQRLRQQLEVYGSCTLNDAITYLVNQRVASFMVVDGNKKVIGLFTARDVLQVLAQSPNKLDAMRVQVQEFMIPLSQLVTCAPEDSLDQCLLVMTEMRIRNLPLVSDGEVAGIINANDICDFSFSTEQLGGKKAFITNISERKGLREGIGIHSPRVNEDLHDHILASVGAAALPHPFKRPGAVSSSARDHRHMDLCMDSTLSEDAHFELALSWSNLSTEALHYIGIADGVGSWRGLGVDPREFPQRLMFWAQQFILSSAPGVGEKNLGEPRKPPKPQQVLQAAWEMVLGEKVVGSSTACIATLDYELDQLTFSNIGDNGVVVLRHIDSDVAGYMRERRTPRHLRTSDLHIAFISQQQLRSFNLPYQLGYTNVRAGGTFETPKDAVNTSIPVMPGDIVIFATDGLYDNVELEEIVDIAEKWEMKWFGGPLRGLNTQNNSAANDLASQLTVRARERSLDSARDSPFALLAKENDIMWGGGMPDDCTVVCMLIFNRGTEGPLSATKVASIPWENLL